MITENASILKINKLTQAQYERELAAGNIDENALYLTPDTEDFLPLSGGFMSGNINMDGHRVLGLYGTGDSAFNTGGIEIREQDGVTNTAWNIEKAPTLGFHWVNTAAGTLVMGADGAFRFLKQDGGVATLQANLASMHGGTLASNANIDNLSCGVYWCDLSSSNGGTIPVADYGVLEVMSNVDSVGVGKLQRFTSYSHGNRVYTRLRVNGAWSSWKQIYGGGGGTWTYTKVIDSKYVGTVSTPVSSHQYITVRGTVNGNLMTKTVNLGEIGLWGNMGISLAHGSSSCNFNITASSITVTPSGSVDDVSGYYMDK